MGEVALTSIKQQIVQGNFKAALQVLSTSRLPLGPVISIKLLSNIARTCFNHLSNPDALNGVDLKELFCFIMESHPGLESCHFDVYVQSFYYIIKLLDLKVCTLYIFF